MDQEHAMRRGYLEEDFRLFHLKDAAMGPVDWHYHSFHKILVLLSGHASYAIEGQSYALEPGDVVLYPGLHSQAGDSTRTDLRAIHSLYCAGIPPAGILPRHRSGGCFRLATEKYSYVLRPDQEVRIIRLLETMRSSQTAPGYGQELLDRALLTQFLIAVTRDLEERQLQYVASASCDKKIVAILKYLNLHLSEPQSIDHLSRQFYISKYYMMRRFKAETGYTIHGYLNEKRLLLAREKIGAGEPLIRVSEDCGFQDYSTFSRAYKKRFGASPNTPISKHQDLVPATPLD